MSNSTGVTRNTYRAPITEVLGNTSTRSTRNSLNLPVSNRSPARDRGRNENSSFHPSPSKGNILESVGRSTDSSRNLSSTKPLVSHSVQDIHRRIPKTTTTVNHSSHGKTELTNQKKDFPLTKSNVAFPSPKSKDSDVSRSVRRTPTPNRNTHNPKEIPNTTNCSNSQSVNHRKNVVEEILLTERDYVRDLKVLIEIFYNPMSKIITQEETNLIFSNIQILVGLNTEILSILDQRINLSDPTTWIMGDIFGKMASFMKLYTEYCSNQDHVLITLEKCRKKYKQLDVFLKETEYTDSVNGLSLGACLIKPVQRICKYPLLLKGLMSNTEDSHLDKKNLAEAMKKMDETLVHLNEMKRRSERMQRVAEIQKRIVGSDVDIIKPHRIFIREGSLIKISKGRAQERVFFLFNDVLIWAKAGIVNKSKDQFKGAIELDKCLVSVQPDTPKAKNGFQLVRVDQKKKRYVICAPSSEVRDEWVKDINMNIDIFLNLMKENSNPSTFSSVQEASSPKPLLEEQLAQQQTKIAELEGIVLVLKQENESLILNCKKLEAELKRYKDSAGRV